MSHIYGYPSRTTVPSGGTLELHYLTDEPLFRVKVYRQGATLALVYTSGWMSAAGTPGQAPVPWNATGDVSADWGWPSIDIPLDPSWEPGVYIVALEAKDADGNVVVTSDDKPYGDSGKAVFVVRGSAGSASILYKLSLTTYHAYNFMGESSLYDGQIVGTAPDGQGGSHEGYKIALLRPGGGTGGVCSIDFDDHDTTLGAPSRLNMFGHWDVHFIQWLEGQGFAVDYCTDLDLHLDAALLAPYRLLLSAGHDEYWSQEMRANVDAFVRTGGNVAFFSGNTCWWRIYFADENEDGVPDAIVCDKRLPDGTYGGGNGADNWWRHSPENTTTGVSTRLGGWIYPMQATGFGYTVQRSSSWVYAGSGVSDGDAFGVMERLIAYEFDGLDYEADPDRPGAMRPTTLDGTPASFVILGLSELPASAPVAIPEREPELSALPSRATMGYFTNAGTVFTGGTTEWLRVLAMADAAVQAITRNIVKGLSSARGIACLTDLDGDGKDDILYTVPLDSGTGIGLWTMSGPDVVGGGYVSDWQEPRWTLVDASDFDGDGNPDLVFHDRVTGEISVWFLVHPGKVAIP
jgi:hypothetical protein